ncbi:hypothetical protein I6A84_06535 [Frankia sp. CNm7]|uniref:Uncharacterized protein n=1 Tax=Frankia nepalensis TaxID=1836974 RepID=A0A937RJU2_9ACTN|nr:hypothetical protein [Frankia nepalensis]MBL7500348.1 hypothetical protein [Frankia nepalensis]MBL7508570.1 hypothetical protein [Frankia nepalensis]MBL7517790.1 hypothetical protein [Frankia nepalensis]MBL7627698.1 hypothetical protein [Frankia nepalensis]
MELCRDGLPPEDVYEDRAAGGVTGSVDAADGDLARARSRLQAAATLDEKAEQPFWVTCSRRQATAAAPGSTQGTGRS